MEVRDIDLINTELPGELVERLQEFGVATVLRLLGQTDTDFKRLRLELALQMPPGSLVRHLEHVRSLGCGGLDGTDESNQAKAFGHYMISDSM